MATLKWRQAYLYWNGAYVTEGTAISVSFDREWIEDTAYGDANRTYQPGFGDFEMTVRRHFDSLGFQGINTDAIASTPSERLFYLYTDRTEKSEYWWGSGYVSLDDHGGDMGSLLDETYTIRASSDITWQTS